jgi:transglycosylase-like protein with SLT domain
MSSGSPAAAARAAGVARAPLGTIASLLGLGLLAALAAVAGVTGASLAGGQAAAGELADGQPAALARTDIPPAYLRLYRAAAQRYAIDWAFLAAIGKVECGHGRDADPSCTREGSVNPAGAGGPMQFIASTWALYGVDADGDGRADRWDPADAIYAAANFLAHAGAPHDYDRALLAYNHAPWYVREVTSWAARYRGTALPGTSEAPLATTRAEAGEHEAGAGIADVQLSAETSTLVRFISGVRALLAPGDGHEALIPTGVPAVVQAMLVAGNELQDLPYGPGGHPDPRGALEEDCSSTVSYALYRSGVRPLGEVLAENPLAQDYVRWGAPGPGRWVTIYSTTSPTNHTFIVIAGLRLDTSHDGTDVGPNRSQDGPRWRILDHIPTWARWSVRHPPGL